MHTTLPSALKDLEFGSPQTFRNLTVVPLVRSVRADDPTYLTLDQAIAYEAIIIQEMSDLASVPELQAINRGDKPVLLVDGDGLMGAKQDRVINLTILVPPGRTTVIPVSCVEAGRWRFKSDRFRAASHTLYARARAASMRDVSASLARSEAPRADQHAVWEDIRAKSAAMNASSPTEAMSDIYARHAAGIEDYARAIQTVPGQVGAVFAVRGTVAGLELFGHTATFVAQFAKILRGYGLDAMEAANDAATTANQPAPPFNDGDARAFVDQVIDAATTGASTFPGVGLGETVRIDKDDVIGAALVMDGQPVHVAAFRKGYGR